MKHFFLDPPDGFVGLDWEREIRRYQRNLPHWRQTGATYFVTFRLADSLPQEALIHLQNLRDDWSREYEQSEAEDKLPFREYARKMSAAEEKWLDQGIGSCVLKNSDVAEIVKQKLHKFHGDRYHLGAWVAMPNHVHAIVRPCSASGQDLDKITKGWKGVSAREINLAMGTTGQTIWQEESFDTIIRDAEHLYQVIQYIGRNPEKAGLTAGFRRWVCEEWEELGYGFTTKW